MKELQQVEEREDQNLAVLEKALDDDEVMQDEIIPRVDTMVDELKEWFDDDDVDVETTTLKTISMVSLSPKDTSMLGGKTRLKCSTPHFPGS